MKILQINNFHYPRGGSDRYFLDITHLLHDAGHEVKTFSTAHPKNVDTDFLILPAIRGIDTARAGGIKNILHFLFSNNARCKMQEAIDKFKPDIAHLHIYYGQLTASILLPLRKAGIPIVQTLHEYKLVCPTQGLYANGQFCDACKGKHFWNAALKRCNRGSIARSCLSMLESYLSNALGASNNIQQFIAVSSFQKKQLIRLGVPENKVTVLYHFSNPVTNPPSYPGKYFLFVGRILEEKGIDVLLNAFALLDCTAPPLKIVGSSDNLQQWQNKSVDLGLKNRIEWVGFKTGKELTQLYQNCLALINPSLLNETFGLTCLEAMSQGRPVIASQVGAFPEVITHNHDGILVKTGSSIALAKAMRQLIEEPQHTMIMGQNSLEKVTNLFSRSSHYQKLCEIYKKIIV